MYRIQLKKGKVWVFVCEACCLVAQKLPEYRYGGTENSQTLKFTSHGFEKE